MDKKKKIKKITFKRSVDELESKPVEKLKAAALRYDLKKDKSPRMVAFGKGRVAHKILSLAEEHKVPIREDKALTELMAKLEIESEIPPQVYTVVAEILAFVYQLSKLAKQKMKK